MSAGRTNAAGANRLKTIFLTEGELPEGSNIPVTYEDGTTWAEWMQSKYRLYIPTGSRFYTYQSSSGTDYLYFALGKNLGAFGILEGRGGRSVVVTDLISPDIIYWFSV